MTRGGQRSPQQPLRGMYGAAGYLHLVSCEGGKAHSRSLAFDGMTRGRAALTLAAATGDGRSRSCSCPSPLRSSEAVLFAGSTVSR